MKIAQWIGLFFLASLLLVLWQLRELLLLIFAAIVLAVAWDTLSLLVLKVRFRGFYLTRWQALSMTALTLLFFTILAYLVIVPPLGAQFVTLFRLVTEGFTQAQEDVGEWINQLRDWMPSTFTENLNTSLTQIDPGASSLPIVLPEVNIQEILQQTGRQLARFISEFVQSSLNTIINLFLSIILTILLTVDPDAYRSAFLQIFPAFYRKRIDYILHRCEVSLRSWLVGILLTSGLVMVMSAVGLWIIGIPLVLANAVLAGIFNLIPNIGPTLSVIFPITVALTISPWKALFVLILYILIQQIESYVLTPSIMKRQLDLLPGLTLLFQVIFATFFGFLGLLLAVPLTAILQVWIQEVVIRDILDKWQKPEFPNDPDDLAIVSQSNSSESIPENNLSDPFPKDFSGNSAAHPISQTLEISQTLQISQTPESMVDTELLPESEQELE
jgi:predicted PurR-regulated permease PerM